MRVHSGDDASPEQPAGPLQARRLSQMQLRRKLSVTASSILLQQSQQLRINFVHARRQPINVVFSAEYIMDDRIIHRTQGGNHATNIPCTR